MRPYPLPPHCIEPGPAEERLFFHHMVGTGGNSLAKTLSLSGGGHRIVQLTHEANGYVAGDTSPLETPGRVLFYGHNLFSLPRPEHGFSSYITILRHPFERLISDFFWAHQRDPRSVAWAQFDYFVRHAPHLEFYIHHCGDLNYLNSQHFDIDECSRLDNAAAAKLANSNLDMLFSFVGIMELFEESLFLLAARAGIPWVAPWWPFRHPHTPYRPGFFDLPRDLRDLIEKKCQHDLELYERARRKFEAAVAEKDFGSALSQYRNDAYARK